MLKSRRIDAICYLIIALALALTVLFMCGERLGLTAYSAEQKYVDALFDTDRVHSVDIIMEEEEWQGLLDNAKAEEYVCCTVVIDGEKAENAGLRCKGNNSLSLTQRYGSERYSLKIEFDHYDNNNSWHGLDKISLNSSFQDNAYMKDYLTYDMMRFMGVNTPLCSYAQVSVNGEAWGLFVAVEEVEEAFARRNYGSNYGLLYKPDYRHIDDPNYDVGLIYTDDAYESYDNIFRNARFDITDADRDRLIASLRQLDLGEDLEQVVDIDQVLPYFVVQTFVVNLDSYLGRTGHNYFLYEEEGRLAMIPWDYNLAFGTYALGSQGYPTDASTFVNYPINTPNYGEIMKKRPLFHKLMKEQEFFGLYHQYYDAFIRDYFESGHFEDVVERTAALIAPYVEADPTAFCSYQDHLLAVDTLREFCLLRAASVRGQLEGTFPSTIAEQERYPGLGIDASHIRLEDLGELADMED